LIDGPLRRAVGVSAPDPHHALLVDEDGGQGWIVASAPELPRVLSQRRDADEQRQMIRAAVPAWAPGPPH
jgi:hypothetical protein